MVTALQKESKIVGYRCDWPECEFLTCRKYVMVNHINGKHTNQRPYSCSMCNFNFVKRYFLKAHMHKVHKIPYDTNDDDDDEDGSSGGVGDRNDLMMNDPAVMAMMEENSYDNGDSCPSFPNKQSMAPLLKPKRKRKRAPPTSFDHKRLSLSSQNISSSSNDAAFGSSHYVNNGYQKPLQTPFLHHDGWKTCGGSQASLPQTPYECSNGYTSDYYHNSYQSFNNAPLPPLNEQPFSPSNTPNSKLMSNNSVDQYSASIAQRPFYAYSNSTTDMLTPPLSGGIAVNVATNNANNVHSSSNPFINAASQPSLNASMPETTSFNNLDSSYALTNGSNYCDEQFLSPPSSISSNGSSSVSQNSVYLGGNAQQQQFSSMAANSSSFYLHTPSPSPSSLTHSPASSSMGNYAAMATTPLAVGSVPCGPSSKNTANIVNGQHPPSSSSVPFDQTYAWQTQQQQQTTNAATCNTYYTPNSDLMNDYEMQHGYSHQGQQQSENGFSLMESGVPSAPFPFNTTTPTAPNTMIIDNCEQQFHRSNGWNNTFTTNQHASSATSGWWMECKSQQTHYTISCNLIDLILHSR